MDEIQETIDEHKSEMPVHVAKKLLELCAEKEKYANLYLIKYAKFMTLPHHHIDDEGDVIVEAQTSAEYSESICEPEGPVRSFFTTGRQFPPYWLDLLKTQKITVTLDDKAIVVFSIEKYTKKRKNF
jgi:hypothetical protein